MERGNHFRWAVAARRFIPNRILALIFQKRCFDVAYKIPEDNDRAIRIGTHCPNGICELAHVGRYGSQGPVDISEDLHSVIIAPTDLDKTALAITMITHAEKKGMSVLRGSASNDEFKETILRRIKKANQTFYGVSIFSCADVRSLTVETDTDQRQAGERIYYVLDTDMEGLPNHAEIFATLPRTHNTLSPKAAWRAERDRLLDVLVRGFIDPADFRGGAVIP